MDGLALLAFFEQRPEIALVYPMVRAACPDADESDVVEATVRAVTS